MACRPPTKFTLDALTSYATTRYALLLAIIITPLIIAHLRALDLWGAHLDAASSPIFAVGLIEGPSFWEVE